jgi:fatty-acyl-CoA synthase
MDWNYGDILDRVATVTPPDRPALIWRQRVITWADFDRRTNNLAAALVSLGLEPNDRAAILCRNHPGYIETMTAEFKARILNVNINYRYTAEEIAYVVDDCQAAAIVYQDDFDATVALLKTRLTSVRVWIRIESDGVGVAPDNGDHSLEALAEAGEGRPLDITRSPEDGYLLYTGGTTGRPKGVLWPTSQSRIVQLESPLISKAPTSLAEHAAMVKVNAAPSRTIPACPLMHGAGSNAAMGDLLNGGTAIILPSDRFDPDELWGEVEKYKATRIALVGDVFAKPLAEALDRNPGRYDVSSIKVITSSGLTWSEAVKRRLLEHMPNALMVDILGASEASGFGYSIARKDHIPPTGLFDAGAKTVLVDVVTGLPLPKDQPAEGFLARTGAMATGYYQDPAKTAETYRLIDGVRHAVPGDLARWAPPNQFTLVGRDNLTINTGGEKVFPEEVEEALKLEPGVEDALVIGIPDEQWGKVVAVLIKAGPTFDQPRIWRDLSKTLSRYKLPKYYLTVEDVPRHESGKADYRRAEAMVSDVTALQTASISAA